MILNQSILAVILLILRTVPPPLMDLPIVLTWYDPILCSEPGGEINCNSDPDHVADGTPVSESLYGVVAACDERLLGSWITIEGIGEFKCRDTGGMIRPTYSEHYGRWILFADIMLHENPQWNFFLFEEWSVRWN